MKKGAVLGLLVLVTVTCLTPLFAQDGIISALPPEQSQAMQRYIDKEMAQERDALYHAEQARRWREDHSSQAYLLDAAIMVGASLGFYYETMVSIFEFTDPLNALKQLVEEKMPDGEDKERVLSVLAYGGTAYDIYQCAITLGVDMPEAVLSFHDLISDVSGLTGDEALYWKVTMYPVGQELKYLQLLRRKLFFIKDDARAMADELIARHIKEAYRDWPPDPLLHQFYIEQVDLFKKDMDGDGRKEIIFLTAYNNSSWQEQLAEKYGNATYLSGTLIWVGRNRSCPKFVGYFDTSSGYLFHDCDNDGREELLFRWWQPHTDDNLGILYFRDSQYYCVTATSWEPEWHAALWQSQFLNQEQVKLIGGNRESAEGEKAKDIFALLLLAWEGNWTPLGAIHQALSE